MRGCDDEYDNVRDDLICIGAAAEAEASGRFVVACDEATQSHEDQLCA